MRGTDRVRRWGGALAAAALFAVLTPASAGADPVGAATAVGGSAAPSVITPAGVGTAALPPRSPFRELQLNLCNSGFAGCYENGQAVPEAFGVITANRPDLVTLNEVCRRDVETALFPAMGRSWPGDHTFWAFMPAHDRRTGAPYLCRNGDQYGIGLLGHVRPADWQGVRTGGGVYPMQDSGSNELRAWVCAEAVGSHYGCTTHLATTGSVAMNQCRHLMNTVLPATWAAGGGYRPSVMGGDLNLRYGWLPPDVQGCVPTARWFRKGDGSVQHVMATNDFTFQSSRTIALAHTDHPGWLVNLTAP